MQDQNDHKPEVAAGCLKVFEIIILGIFGIIALGSIAICIAIDMVCSGVKWS